MTGDTVTLARSLANRLILLVYEDDFTAGYLESALRRAGAEVLRIGGDDCAYDAERVSLCIVSPQTAQQTEAGFDRRGARRPRRLLVEAACNRQSPGSEGIMYPFAAYQVVDAALDLLYEERIVPPTC